MKIMDILAKDALVLESGRSDQARGVGRNGRQRSRRWSLRSRPTTLLEVLLEREALQSTGIGEGVAIPHGKLAGL